MSYFNGPKIVSDGLALCLDAANPKSYIGSGTSWNDLSGNNNTGTLTNGPTYTSSFGGGIVFDGTNDYVVSTGPTINPNTNGFSFECMFTSDVNNTSYSTYKHIVWMNGGPGNFFGILVEPDSRGYRLDVPSSANDRVGVTTNITITANIPQHIVWTWLNGVFKFYINGILQVNSDQTVYTAGSFTSITLGYGYNGYWVGKIFLTRLYNNVLSNTQVLQNYNATKGRYGL